MVIVHFSVLFLDKLKIENFVKHYDSELKIIEADGAWIKKEQLLDLILKNSFVSIGKMYGVSDNAVRKWCKKYKLPFRKKDIDIYQKIC